MTTGIQPGCFECFPHVRRAFPLRFSPGITRDGIAQLILIKGFTASTTGIAPAAMPIAGLVGGVMTATTKGRPCQVLVDSSLSRPARSPTETAWAGLRDVSPPKL